MSRLAALLAGLALTALVLGLVVRATNGFLPPLTDESWVLSPLAVGLPIVGAAIARRQPRHLIAWTFLGSGLAMFSYENGHYALITKPGAVPLGALAAWVAEWMWTTAAIPLLTFGLLLFPDGHLPSRRWRPVAWLAGATPGDVRVRVLVLRVERLAGRVPPGGSPRRASSGEERCCVATTWEGDVADQLKDLRFLEASRVEPATQRSPERPHCLLMKQRGSPSHPQRQWFA